MADPPKIIDGMRTRPVDDRAQYTDTRFFVFDPRRACTQGKKLAHSPLWTHASSMVIRRGMPICTATALAFALATGSTERVGAQRAPAPDFLFRPPAATLTFFGALSAPSAGSDLYDFSFDELTLRREDLRTMAHGVDLAIRLSPRTEGVVGVAFGRSAHRSSFRNYVDLDDQEIEQTTVLTRVPIGASVRYYLTPRGEAIGSRAWIPARFTPWVGVGGGMMQYRFAQFGEFINFDNLDVFRAHYTTSNRWAPFAQGSIGAGWSMTRRVELAGELRYVRASGKNGADFEGFDPIDLSAVSTSVGLTLRF